MDRRRHRRDVYWPRRYLSRYLCNGGQYIIEQGSGNIFINLHAVHEAGFLFHHLKFSQKFIDFDTVKHPGDRITVFGILPVGYFLKRTTARRGDIA
ncbi:hypothetical protein SGGMMB4_03111 [Sodalis glossinidius str. 'morsitans']|uniref:Uncharacterized protein n=1 Tax=Sodalis glossinidius (strain morsitans) TaxID=343509 RepID=A0A193QJQ5_SODGM|nr:hypothetical protein SGGMMB4_03111 [Sodalis glossinidius str. 'morsitans']